MLSYAKISELNWIAKHGPNKLSKLWPIDSPLGHDEVVARSGEQLRGSLPISTKREVDEVDWEASWLRLIESSKALPALRTFLSVWQCDSLWQFVTVWWFHVHCIVTRITRIVYDISVWFIYDIFMSIFPFLPVSSGYLPYFVEESEEKDVLARLPLDQLLKDDIESVATKSTDMWHEYSNCQVNGL